MHASHSSTVEAFHGFLTNCRLLPLRFSPLLIMRVLCVCVFIIMHIFDSSNTHAEVQVLLKRSKLHNERKCTMETTLHGNSPLFPSQGPFSAIS